MAEISFDTDFQEASAAIEPYGLIFRDLIVKAVAKERERCAKLAERHSVKTATSEWLKGYRDASNDIAARIRAPVSGTTEGGRG
ncbi:hypothetical protein [Bradyrhizobium elkanii]|uniref:hypothetical protein n=1 Tax=Bradyrhizobium elkanii TaxID=29448 RepID=UPI002225E898|nr:hypothetical protein [Bradyrhizobium elkanii]MCW2228129.1 hypothetical protein [Bradyrhizobium elkanii]